GSKQNRKRRRESTTERDHRGNASAAGTKAHYFRDTTLTRRAKYGCGRQQECDAQSQTSNCTWHFAEVAYDLGRSNDKDCRSTEQHLQKTLLANTFTPFRNGRVQQPLAEGAGCLKSVLQNGALSTQLDALCFH